MNIKYYFLQKNISLSFQKPGSITKSGNKQVVFPMGTQALPTGNLQISQDILIKVEYLNNRVLDHTQILNLDLGDQSKVFKYFNEDDPWKTTLKY